MSTGGIIGGVVGGVVGFFLGGPVGAAMGAGIGMGLGMAIDPITPDMPAPGEPDIAELSINQAQEGSVVVDFLGTTKISAANYLWYGKERVEEVVQEQESGGKGGGGSSEDVVTGHQHFLSWALGIATGPIDNLYTIFKGDDVVWSGNLACPASGGEETIDLGVVSIDLRFHRTVTDPGEIISMGSATFYFGTTDQVANAAMTAELGSKLNPPYRRQSYCFFDDCFIGGYNRAPTMKFIAGKYPVFAFSSKNTINTYDYNPAHAIWYIKTEMVGLADSYLDSTSFSDAADTLYAEGLGVSINFNRQQDAETYIESILRHIDGILRYENDGRLHLKLNRDDIAVGSLPTVSKDDMLDDLQINRKSWIDTLNDIKVQYVKRTGSAATADESADIGEGGQRYIKSSRAVTRTSNGDLSVVFDYESPPGIGYGKSVDNGATWTITRLNTATVAASPQIFSDDNDNLFILSGGWSAPTANVLYLRRSSDGGQSWTGAQISSIGTLGAIFVCGSGGKSYIIWGGTTTGGATAGIGIRRSLDYGATWAAEERVGTLIDNVYDLGASIDESGDLHIVASTKYGGNYGRQLEYVSGIPSAGAVPAIWGIDGESVYKNLNCWQLMPCVVVDSANAPHVVWTKFWNGTSQAYPGYAKRNILTGAWSTPIDLSSDVLDNYSMVSASTYDNTIHVVWNLASDTAIKHAVSTDLGVSWGTALNLITGSSLRSPNLLWAQNPASVAPTSGFSLCHREYVAPEIHTQYYGSSSWSVGDFFDFEEVEINVRDPANQELVKKINHKTVKMGMFAVPASVAWIADRLLKSEAYPLASYAFPANRNIFRWDPGDAFVQNYAPYSISGKVCRVVSLTEDDAESEVITVNAVEDIHYLASETSFTAVEGDPDIRDSSVDALVTMDIFDAPYVLAGELREIISVAGRETGNELGYQLFMSIDDGISYSRIGIVTHYTPYGTLDAEYPATTYQIDDETGFEITFSAESQVASIETTTREHLLNGKYIALLGDELISFQTITPVSGTTYKLENIFRGRFDTEKATHAAASPFWLLGLSFFGILQHANLLVGESRKFKMVPYNARSTGSLSSATVTSHTVTGRALTPYRPINLAADGKGIRPTYTGGDDIVLTWRARIRGADWADFECNAPPTWEGYFEVEVWVATVLVRTTSDIDAVTWTYTNAMNVEDNGAAASSIEFKVKSFIDGTGRRYSSTQDTLTVTKE